MDKDRRFFCDFLKLHFLVLKDLVVLKNTPSYIYSLHSIKQDSDLGLFDKESPQYH